MKAVKALWNKPATQWVCKTLYYFSILLGLLWLYGFTDTNTSTFIYNEF
ncbi:teichoic acid D-Ala incorporation-associated protein DltX [Ectobacillus antri]|uniref:Teichoic acid D-Ala incorporation-associated protein DltX n=1 Tax=Ectobacillus antri TaxID=2486280 RepID=A0ABT6H3V0_9BACI|nr:teichoic acid D-Ala incorporation-associated protein DltX [Ectobacillus antri]MDG4658381.1 teichoic acid D-Ala incorporation-associated protein DltX [Ectobacillus antri]MDG5753715.1 teichoic acid D-Ala incorporation-associated protein DltX [Ectobacillus antri]